MKLKYVGLAAMLVLAACSNSQPQEGASVKSAPAAQVAMPAFWDPLPGFSPDIPFHFRADKIYEKPNGQLRRGIVLEYLGGGADAAFAATLKALKRVGYEPKGGREVGADGVVKQQFTKMGGLYLEVAPFAGEYPSHPDAKGTISASWPIKSASDPTPVGKKAQ